MQNYTLCPEATRVHCGKEVSSGSLSWGKSALIGLIALPPIKCCNNGKVATLIKSIKI